MRRLEAVLALVVLAGCAGKKEAPVAGDAAVVRPVEPVDYEIAVAVQGLDVSMVLTDRLAHCERFKSFLPELETCEPISDDIQVCGSLRCLHSVRLEQAARTIMEIELEGETRKFQFGLMPMGFRMEPDAGPARLVIDGCGKTARVPLPTTPLAKPTVTATTGPDGAIDVLWSGAEGATSSLTRAADGYTGRACRAGGRGPVHIAVRERDFLTSFSVLTDPDVHDTPLGPVLVWRAARAALDPTATPRR